MKQDDAREKGRKQIERLVAAGRLLAVGEVEPASDILVEMLREDPDHVDALNWMAAIKGIEGRSDEAFALIDRASRLAPHHPAVQTNRGNILLDAGDFEGAVTAYRNAVRADEKAYGAMNNLGALLNAYGMKEDAERMLRLVIQGLPEYGLAHYNLSHVLGAQGRFDEAVQHAQLATEYMPRGSVSVEILASAYIRNNDRKGAIAVVRKWVESKPADQEAAHFLKVIEGREMPERATDAFIEGLFDRFSASFDSKLARLEYRAPELVGKVLDEFAGAKVRALRVLDIGCGTGLCAVHARDFAAHLTGIDLSGGMLRRAAQTGLYDRLVKAELTRFLGAVNEPYDVALSADTLCYFGPLDTFAAGAARALVPQGLLTFTVEALDDRDMPYHLEVTGRYQHAAPYVASALEGAGFEVVRISREKLRMNYGEPVMGHLVVARRR